MTLLGSVDAVIAAIDEEAAADVEVIERDAANACEQLRQVDDASPVAVDDGERRIAAARRDATDKLAAEDRADHEAALSERERWLEAVAIAGKRVLSELDRDTARADAAFLAREALSRMPPESIELLVPPWAQETVEQMLRDDPDTARWPAVRPRADAAVTSGCIAQTSDGRLRYDNTYPARAKRLEAALRARIGELYEKRMQDVVGQPG